MLAIIGEFEFKVNDTSYEEFQSKITFNFATHENVGGFNTYQSIGKYEETNTLKGNLIAKSQKQLKEFESMAKLKQNQTIAFSSGSAYTILIFSIAKTKRNFLQSGEFLEQAYEIELQIVGGL